MAAGNLVETSGVQFGSLKTFFLSALLENFRIDTSLNILVIQNSKTRGETSLSQTIQMSRIVENFQIQTAPFQNKAGYRAENRPEDISLKCLLPDFSFFWSQVQTTNTGKTFIKKVLKAFHPAARPKPPKVFASLCRYYGAPFTILMPGTGHI